MNKLCISWEANGGKGYSSISDNTPENKSLLEAWIERLKKDWPRGTFEVTEYPHGQTFSLPGSLVARQPSGHA